MLNVKSLSAGYGKIRVVHEVTFGLVPGECVSIVGANGAGKSTLVKAIAGLVPSDSGSIVMNDTALSDLPAYRRARLGLGTVPEEFFLFPEMTVRDTLLLAKGRYSAVADGTPTWDLPRIFDLFPPIKARVKTRVGNLSGGEKRMTAIARALLLEPHFLLLDEPSAGLAPIVLKDIEGALHALLDEGIGILLTEQNTWFAQRVARSVVKIVEGRLVPDRSAPADICEGIRDAVE